MTGVLVATLFAFFTVSALADHGSVEPIQPNPASEKGETPSKRIVLSVVDSAQVARERLTLEARKGALPQSAVEPLLAKIAPVMDRLAEQINEAAGDPDKIRAILKDAPTLRMTYVQDNELTEVIAKVVTTESTTQALAPIRFAPVKPSTPTGSNEANSPAGVAMMVGNSAMSKSGFSEMDKILVPKPKERSRSVDSGVGVSSDVAVAPIPVGMFSEKSVSLSKSSLAMPTRRGRVLTLEISPPATRDVASETSKGFPLLKKPQLSSVGLLQFSQPPVAVEEIVEVEESIARNGIIFALKGLLLFWLGFEVYRRLRPSKLR